MTSFKLQRMASEMAEVISDILAHEANDSWLKTITITGCEIAKDLSIAKVYFTSLSDLLPAEAEAELSEAAKYIRKEVANRMTIRHTPKLHFIFDQSIAYGHKIEKIIEAIHSESNKVQ